MKNTLATTFALSAAALFLAGCEKKSEAPETTPPDATSSEQAGDAAADGASTANIKCFGINECAGQSACDVAGSHECGGENDCAGKGWILIPKAECDEKGGTVV